MATKSIIDIQVDDTQFKDFYALWQKFQVHLESMPEEWKKFSKSTEGVNKGFKAISDAIEDSANEAVKLTLEIKKAKKAQDDFGNSSNQANKSMSKMADNAAKVGKSLFGIGKFLLKLDVLGAGIVGLGTLGGFLGLNSLANSAVQTQRSARGLSLNPGQLRAFNVDFSRYANPALLGNIANAQNDFTQLPYLARAAGVNISQAQNQSVDQLAIKTLIRAHNWWNNTPSSLRTAQTLQAAGFSQIGYTLEDVRRLGNTPLSDLTTAQSQYNRDKSTLNVSNQATSAWYALTRQLSLAGEMIETNLTNKLQALGPALGNISVAFAKDVNALINGITPKQIEDFANGIKSFAQTLTSPQTIQDLKDFVKAMGDIAHLVLAIAKWGNSSSFSLSTNTNLSPVGRKILSGTYKQDSLYVVQGANAFLPNVNHNSNINTHNTPLARSNKTLNINGPRVKSNVHVTITNKTGSDIFTSNNAMVY